MSCVLHLLSKKDLLFRKENLLKQLLKVENELERRDNIDNEHIHEEKISYFLYPDKPEENNEYHPIETKPSVQKIKIKTQKSTIQENPVKKIKINIKKK